MLLKHGLAGLTHKAAAGGGGLSIVGWTAANKPGGSAGVTLDLTALDANGSALGTGDGGAVLEDDVVYLVNATNSNSSRTVTMSTAGYTQLNIQTQFPGNDITSALHRKVQGATPDTTAVSSQNGDTTAGHICLCVVVRGADTTTPEDVAAVESSADNDKDPNPASVTPVTAGAYILTFGACTDIPALTNSLAVNADMSEIGQHEHDSGSRSICVAAGIKTDWTSGAFDGGVWTASPANDTGNASSANTIAIKPV